jgi:mono/diheme cytochrome c family protein
VGAGRMRQARASAGAAAAVAMSAACCLVSFTACAQEMRSKVLDPGFSPGSVFVEKDGETLFARVCQGCHMVDAKGATGAGTYPSLAGNSNLQTGAYAVAVVVNGQRGMPPFGAAMSNDQIVAVVNYVRTHFGNHYTEAVTVEDVRAARR